MTESAAICAFVQARMSSRRFPGKVLAPFRGKPLIRHVLDRLHLMLAGVKSVVVTSSDQSDDPLVAYISSHGVPHFRGSLDDVFERFRRCLEAHPCRWILRICADSPFLDGEVLEAVVSRADDPKLDLVTTIFPRTFPRGLNAELIRTDTLLAIRAEELADADREHVTPFFYRNHERFRILNIESGDPQLSGLSFAVDTIGDLRRLEATTSRINLKCSPTAGSCASG
jgi:spore coat polysaccharide biosynthesis protein SpsF